MRIRVVALVGLAWCVQAFGGLQNVETGGAIRIRGNYWIGAFNSGIVPSLVRHQVRFPGTTLFARPIGAFLGPGVRSFHDWDDRGADYKQVVQRTLLHARADFTHDVAAYIELESFDVWGEDFRSEYLTGSDFRAISNNDVEVFQSYVEANNVFGYPIRARLGRQTLVLGDGWLIGDRQRHPEFTGLSFDAIRLTYGSEPWTIDAFWAKLAENSPIEEDGDVDLYGVYATWDATDALTLDAYWLLLRDAAARRDTATGLFATWLEDILGLDDYDPTELHTVGLRAAAAWNVFDVDLDVAYQFGDASAAGVLFRPFTYGDDSANWNALGAKAEVGYTFDTARNPRVFLTAAYYEGEDNRDITFWEWLFPWNMAFEPPASIGFNRLFSNTVHSYFLDQMAQLSNVWTVGGGIQLQINESLSAELTVDYFAADEPFDYPPYISFAGIKSVWLPGLSFWTREADAELGWETDLSLTYAYSEDLTFRCGWSHFFAGDGVRDGSFVDLHGLISTAGTAAEDADYLFAETTLRF
jgi:hypothetical protein